MLALNLGRKNAPGLRFWMNQYSSESLSMPGIKSTGRSTLARKKALFVSTAVSQSTMSSGSSRSSTSVSKPSSRYFRRSSLGPPTYFGGRSPSILSKEKKYSSAADAMWLKSKSRIAVRRPDSGSKWRLCRSGEPWISII